MMTQRFIGTPSNNGRALPAPRTAEEAKKLAATLNAEASERGRLARKMRETKVANIQTEHAAVGPKGARSSTLRQFQQQTGRVLPGVPRSWALVFATLRREAGR